MGYDTDVLMFDWNVLVHGFVRSGCYDREVVEKVLHMYGEKISDKYVLLMIEEYGDLCPTVLLCCAMESLFDIDGCSDTLFDMEYIVIGGGYSDNCGEKEEELAELATSLENEQRCN